MSPILVSFAMHADEDDETCELSKVWQGSCTLPIVFLADATCLKSKSKYVRFLDQQSLDKSGF